MHRATLFTKCLFACLFVFTSACCFADDPILVIDPQGHSAAISGLMFAPDGSVLISVSHDKTIRLWDVETGDLRKTIRGYIGEGPEGMLLAGALSPDGKTLAVGGFLGKQGDDPEGNVGQIRLFDIESGEQIGVIKGHGNVVFGLDFSHDGKWLATASGDRSSMIWDISPLLTQKGADARLVAVLGGSDSPGPPVFDVAFSPRKQFFVSTAFWRTLVLRELRKNPVGVSGFDVVKSYYDMEGHRDQVYCVDYAPNGEYIVSGGKDGLLLLWDGTGKFLKQLDRFEQPVATVSFSGDSAKIVASGMAWQATGVYAIPSGEKLFTFAQHTNTVEASAFSGENLVATAGGDQNDLYIWDAASGTVTTHIIGKGLRVLTLAFDAKGSLAFGNSDRSPSDFKGEIPQQNPEYIPLERSFNVQEMRLERNLSAAAEFTRVQVEYQGKTLVPDTSHVLKISDGTALETIENYPQYDGTIRSYTFTPAGDIVVGSSYSLKLYDSEGFLIRDFVGHTGEVWTVSMSNDGRILASGSDDQTIKLWNPATGECLATLFVASDYEWVCWTPQGYYAASAGGEKYIGWHINQGMHNAALYYPVSVFRKQYYRPELVKRTIEIGSFEQAFKELEADIEETKDASVLDLLPPKVSWISPESGIAETSEGSIRIHAKIDSDSDLTLVKVLVNGRTQATGRGLAVSSPAPDVDSEIEQEIPLLPGRNTITIFAANEETGSTSSERIVTYRSEEHLPDLYVVAIGISEYLRRELQLEYADDDARAIGQIFRNREGRLYRKIFLEELYDTDATQANILDALAWLKESVTQKDVAVIFMAAHGNNEKGQYFLLPADVDPEEVPGTGIGWTHLAEMLGSLPSKVLLVLDTCHSGQLGQNVLFEPRQVDNTEALRTLASDEYGVVILAASTGQEFSLEHADWGHGAFTKALLEALEEGLADYSEDGLIHLRELDLYVAERVEELTDGEQHPTTQKPSTISRFPIVEVK